MGSGRRALAAAVTAGLVATALILVWGLIRSPAAAFDDAYITYRYADNLRRGLGLFYNPGEWVLGTTTPLFTLLLGGLALLVADIEWLGHWIGILSWIGAIWAAPAIFRQAGRPGAAVVAPLLLAVQAGILTSVGMETPFLIMLMLATTWALLGTRRATATVLAAALFLTRQDSAIWLLLLGLEVWRRERRFPWREGLAAALLTIPWFLFAQWRYGSFLPNSAAAKFGQNTLMPVTGLSPFWLGLLEQSLTTIAPLTMVALLIGLLTALWVIARGKGRAFWWLPAWLIAYTLFYSLTGIVSFPWYFAPALMGIAMLLALGVGALLGDEPVPGGNQPRLRRPLRALGVLLLVPLLFGHGRNAYLAAQGRHGYQPAYVPAANWLAGNTAPDAAVATIEIGIIGYHSNRPIVDTMGLISPDMTGHQLGWQETLVYALNTYQPDYLITLPDTAWDNILAEWWFQRDYRPAAFFDNVTIFERSAADDDWYEVPLEVSLAQGVTLTGIASSTQALQPGEQMDVNVAVQVDETPRNALLVTAYLVDVQTYDRVATTTVTPFSGRYDSRLWQPDDRLQIPMRLALPANLQPGVYRLGLEIFDVERGAALPLREDPAGPPPELQAGWFRAGPVPSVSSTGATTALPTARWEDGIDLESLAAPAAASRPGETLPLQLTWHATRPVDRDLTFFVHLTGQSGEIVSQHDARPVGGRWPTPAWLPGDLLSEEIELVLPADLAPGQYGLRLGFYDTAGRLPLADGTADSWFIPVAVSVSSR